MNWLDKINKELENYSDIIIWGAGSSTKQFLLQLPPQIKEKKITIVDNNRDLSGTKFLCFQLISPSEMDFSKVQVVVITSLVFHNEIAEQVRSLSNFKGKIIDFFVEKAKSYSLLEWSKSNNAFIREKDLPPFILTGTDTLLLTSSGLKFCLSEEEGNNQVIYNLIENKDYEVFEMEVILSNLSEDSCFFDIGANVGWFTINLAKKFKKIELHAFEPGKSALETLQKNLHYNEITDKVKVNNVAICETDKRLFFTSDLDTGNYIKQNRKPGTVEIMGISIDSYVEKNKIKKLDFIKCDVEGAELLVLKGAKKSLLYFKPKILMEIFYSWCRRFNYTPKDLFAFMDQIGYVVYSFEKGKIEHFVLRDETTINTNFLFVHKKDLAKSQWRKISRVRVINDA